MVDEKIPTCFLGCCNVRSWTLFIAISNIISFSLQLIASVIQLVKTPEVAIFSICINIIGLYINIRLRRGVLKRDIAPIRLWLWIYSILFIISIFFVIIGLILISFMDFNDTEDSKSQKQFWIGCLITTLIIDGIVLLWCYPVYQFYRFEKIHQQQTVVFGHQNI